MFGTYTRWVTDLIPVAAILLQVGRTDVDKMRVAKLLTSMRVRSIILFVKYFLKQKPQISYITMRAKCR